MLELYERHKMEIDEAFRTKTTHGVLSFLASLCQTTEGYNISEILDCSKSRNPAEKLRRIIQQRMATLEAFKRSRNLEHVVGNDGTKCALYKVGTATFTKHRFVVGEILRGIHEPLGVLEFN